MTTDPVLAADGMTYERINIQDWFAKNMKRIENAQENLRWNPNSVPDQRVVQNGILSPAFGTKMDNLILTPNTSIRNMARSWKESKEAARF